MSIATLRLGAFVVAAFSSSSGQNLAHISAAGPLAEKLRISAAWPTVDEVDDDSSGSRGEKTRFSGRGGSSGARAFIHESDKRSAPRKVSVLGRPDPRMSRAVNEAVARAVVKLGEARCRRVFSDFLDRGGRTLQENLDARAESPAGYLRWLIFVNAAEDGYCLRGGVVAGTNPRDRFVRLCAPFRKIAVSDPGHAAAVVIHEELHSLGLEENPPSTYEINAQVVRRCGR